MKKVFNAKAVLLVVLSFVLVLQPMSVMADGGSSWQHTVKRNGNDIVVDWDDVPESVKYTVTPIRDGKPSSPVEVTDSEFTESTKPNISYVYSVSATVAVADDNEEPAPDPENSEEDETPPEQAETTYQEQQLFVTNPLKYALTKISAKAKLNTYNSAKITYNSVYGADGYQIYRATSKTGKYSLIKTTTATSYTNTGLSLYKSFYYKVRAYQKVGNKNYYTNSSTTSAVKTALGKTKLTTSKLTYKSVKLSYKKAEGASKYKIYKSTSSKKGFKLVKTTSSLSYTAKSLKTGKKYYFKVRPYKGKIAGAYTKTVKVKPALKKTSINRIDLTGVGKAKVSWGKVSGASGYKLYRATSKNGKYKLVKTTKSHSYTNKKLKNNKTYYFKVKSYRKVGKKKVNSPYSSKVKTVTAKKASQYRMKSSGFLVLVTNGYGYYEVCKSTKCNWYNDSDENGFFSNRAYVYVPAGYYITLSSSSKDARIIDDNYYYGTMKSSFTKAGHYLVGFDLKPGTYKTHQL